MRDAQTTVDMTATGPAVRATRLSSALLRPLNRLRRRLRALAVARGVGTTLLALALLAVIGMAIDLAVVLPPWARWSIWSSGVAVIVSGVAFGVMRPLLLSHDRTHLAALLERPRPELRERLSVAVALDHDQSRGRAHGDPGLIAAQAREAASHAGSLSPSLAAPAKPAFRRLGLGLIAASLVAAPAVFVPDPVGTLAHRLIAPWSNVERVGRFVISVRNGDRIVAQGDDTEIVADVRPRYGRSPAPGAATIAWTDASGRSHRQELAPGPAQPGRSGPDRSWRTTLPRLPGSIRYHVEAASARSPSHQITALPAPTVAQLAVTVTPPSYTGQKAAPARDPNRVEAWERSAVTLRMTASRSLRSAVLSWPEPSDENANGAITSASMPRMREVRATPDASDQRVWTATVPALVSGPFHYDLIDVHGLSSRPDPPRRLAVRVDAPPTVAFTDAEPAPAATPEDANAARKRPRPRPARGNRRGQLNNVPVATDEVAPDDVIAPAVAARDDLAVSAAEVHWSIRRAGSDPAAPGDSGSRPVGLAGLGTPSASGEATLDLRSLELRPGDTLSYRVRVIDSKPAPGGPQEGWTHERSMHVVARAEPLAQRQGDAARQSLASDLKAIRQAAEANRQATEQLRYAADAAQRGNGEWSDAHRAELARRDDAARDTEEKLLELAREAARTPGFASLERPARQVAEVEARAARERLDDAAKAGADADRFAAMKRADEALAATVQRLDELARRLDEAAKADADRRRLAALANRQEALANDAAAMAENGDAAPDRAALDQARAEQDRLSNELAEVLKRNPALRAEALAARVREAAELAEAARALADDQRDAARRTAEPDSRNPALRALAEAQRAIEDDARRLALRADPALVDNGRARLNPGALAEPIEPITRGDFEPARQSLEAAESELERLTRDLEDVPNDPKALVNRLVRRQESIQREAEKALGATIPDRNKITGDQRAALSETLKPLADLVEETARVASAVPVPRDQVETRKQAVEGLEKARDELRKSDGNPGDLGPRQREARDALQRLANALPDPWRRGEPLRRGIDEARKRIDEVARDLERHLRETGPQPGKPFDADRADADLANRLAELAKKQADAAGDLEALDLTPAPRLEPQRRRAAARARALADGLARARRDTLPDLARDARAAADRLLAKAQGRNPADDRAAEINDDANANTKAKPQELAAAVRALDAPDALPEQLQALRAIEAAAIAEADAEAGAGAKPKDDARDEMKRAVAALAHRLAAPDAPDAKANANVEPAPDAAKPADLRARAGDIANRQRELAKKLDAEKDRAKAEPDPNAARASLTNRLAPIAAEQEALLAAARALTDPRPPAQPEHAIALKRREQAAAVQARAIEAMTRKDPERGAALAREAAEALDQLARDLPETAPEPDPAASTMPADPALARDLPPELRDEARDLSRRQRGVREQFQALLAEHVPEQQKLRSRATELGERFQALHDRAAELSPRVGGPARQAAQVLNNQAPPTMDQAVDQMNRGEARPARETQRRAGEQLDRAAQQAEDLVAALRAESARAPDAPDEAGEPSNRLADAQDAQARAAAMLAQARAATPDAAAQASQAMKRAADDLREAALPRDASALAQADPAQAPPNAATNPDPEPTMGGRDDPDLAILQAQLRAQTGRAWGELPGHLRSELLRQARGRYRDDYARLIRLYFRELAAPTP
jgi:hypothetical protein